jgi:hypothetical protein
MAPRRSSMTTCARCGRCSRRRVVEKVRVTGWRVEIHLKIPLTDDDPGTHREPRPPTQAPKPSSDMGLRSLGGAQGRFLPPQRPRPRRPPRPQAPRNGLTDPLRRSRRGPQNAPERAAPDHDGAKTARSPRIPRITRRQQRQVAGAVARPGSHRTVRALFASGSSGRRVVTPAAGRLSTSIYPCSRGMIGWAGALKAGRRSRCRTATEINPRLAKYALRRP